VGDDINTFEEFGREEGGAAITWTVMMRDYINSRPTAFYQSGQEWLWAEDATWRAGTIAALEAKNAALREKLDEALSALGRHAKHLTEWDLTILDRAERAEADCDQLKRRAEEAEKQALTVVAAIVQAAGGRVDVSRAVAAKGLRWTHYACGGEAWSYGYRRCEHLSDDAKAVSCGPPVSHLGNTGKAGNGRSWLLAHTYQDADANTDHVSEQVKVTGPKANGAPPDCGSGSTQFDSARSLQVPYATQHAALLKQLALGPDAICDFIREHWPEIARMAADRFEIGFEDYGSEMYRWDEATWVRNVREEAADMVVYLSRDVAQ
jgi:hypothetical protein